MQIEAEAHSNSKISVHERGIELPDREVHSDLEVDIPNEERRVEPRLSNYARRHHPTGKII